LRAQFRAQQWCVSHDHDQAAAGDAKEGVERTQRHAQALSRVTDLAPPRRIGWWPQIHRVPRACFEKGDLVGEVAIERPAGHARPLCNRQVGRMRRTDGRVQLYCGVDDSLASLVLTLRASLEGVFPRDFRELLCDLIVDMQPGNRYGAISIQA
jgi:hypothetical protein